EDRFATPLDTAIDQPHGIVCPSKSAVGKRVCIRHVNDAAPAAFLRYGGSDCLVRGRAKRMDVVPRQKVFRRPVRRALLDAPVGGPGEYQLGARLDPPVKSSGLLPTTT